MSNLHQLKVDEMKNTLLVLLVSCGLFSSVTVKAQPFVMAVSADTIYATANSSGQVPGATDFITNTTSSGLTLKWRVTGTNFPADWLTQDAFGICDNGICRYNMGDTLLWNYTTGVGGPLNTTASYIPDSAMTFELSLYLSGASTGTHWVSVLITDPAITPAYSKVIYFVITNGAATAVNPVNRNTEDVLLYPNPARDELNIVYDASADVKNIAVYNIIGKVMAVYKVNGPSANLNLESMPSGIYFVRLANSFGQVVATKKFTKQ